MVGQSHGGRRIGAGRKRALSSQQQFLIGAECERRWEEAAVNRALAQYERQDWAGSIRDEQGRASLIPLRIRKTRDGKRARSDINEEIEAILEGPPLRSRFNSIAMRRPWGLRAAIIGEVRAWARDRYSIDVTARRIEHCWDGYRVFKRSAST